MRDPEVIELRNKFLLAVGIVLIFAIPLLMFFCKGVVVDTDIYKYIKQKESFVILIENKECTKCESVEQILDSRNIPYHILDADNNDDYWKILERLNLEDKNVVMPTLIYVNNGSLGAYIYGIDNEDDIDEFINLNNL